MKYNWSKTGIGELGKPIADKMAEALHPVFMEYLGPDFKCDPLDLVFILNQVGLNFVSENKKLIKNEKLSVKKLQAKSVRIKS